MKRSAAASSEPTEVIGQAEVEGLVDHSIVVVQLTGDIQRLQQVAAGDVNVADRQLDVAQVAEHRPDLPPVTNLPVELEGLRSITGRASAVILEVQGKRPGG